MNTNVFVGGFILLIATITIIFSFLIAFRQYIFPTKTAQKFASPATLPTDLIKMFFQLLDDILKAPPALAFLVSGLLIGAVGIWILTQKPF